MSHITVQIEKVLELVDTNRDPNCPDSVSIHFSKPVKRPTSVYAHVSKPVKRDGQDVQYVMLAISPQHGIMYLGEINPETRMFEHYDPEMRDPALYTRAGNHVVNQVSVSGEQLSKLKTLDEVLGIQGIFVRRRLTPE